LVDIDEMLADGLLTKNGNVYTMTKDVSHPYIRFSGWCTFKNPLPAGTYTIGADLVEDKTLASASYWLEADIRLVDGTQVSAGLIKNSTSGKFTAKNEIEKIRFYLTSSNEDKAYYSFKNFMFCAGDTLKPYQPYFTDLKHAKIDSIVSTGRNLLDMSKLVGGALVDNGDGTYTMTKNGGNRFSKTWTLDTPIYIGENMNAFMETINSNLSQGLKFSVNFANGKSNTVTFNVGTFGAHGVIKNISLYLESSETNGASITFKNPCLTRSSTVSAMGYTPFIQETYQIPETLELGQWDSFNPQTGEVVRQTETIILDGSKAWITNGEDGTVTGWYSKPEHWYVYAQYIDNAFISSKFLIGWMAGYNFAKVFPAGTTLDEVQAYYNGIVVAGKLAIPTIEKLENAPKSYKVHNHGSETAVNENEEYGAVATITNEYIVVL
jgi:hypothetical protein